MSIHPEYADAILRGTKRVEFRKRPLAADVTTVVIYATAPLRRVVGTFEIERSVVATPATLWRRFSDVGGISKADFFAYYDGTDRAVGLVIRHTTRWKEALTLSDLRPGLTPPQSFLYLPDTTLRRFTSADRPVLTAIG